MYANSNPRRLKLQLPPDHGEAITICRDKVRLFKAWMEREVDEGLAPNRHCSHCSVRTAKTTASSFDQIGTNDLAVIIHEYHDIGARSQPCQIEPDLCTS